MVLLLTDNGITSGLTINHIGQHRTAMDPYQTRIYWFILLWRLLRVELKGTS